MRDAMRLLLIGGFVAALCCGAWPLCAADAERPAAEAVAADADSAAAADSTAADA
ncbi:MAG: hypothetical protein GF330_05905, partial [Candidatus Eisenbacteria bacterium]|nr:hypothetical protein [Candidatus Eisenbacteria bacterium]